MAGPFPVANHGFMTVESRHPGWFIFRVDRSPGFHRLISAIDLSAFRLELAAVKQPQCAGVQFCSILKDPKATVRHVVFEHNGMYRNHERMVRFGDYLYIRTIF